MKIRDIKIVFMGTPEISANVLEKIILDGFNVVGVVAQPDRPVGRKQIIMPVPTKVIATKYNIPCYQKEKIRLDYEFLKEINPDLIITLAFGQIVPQGLLDIPKYGCLNLHGSLLPKYRGAAPIQYALINNDKVTGMSLMEMIDKMDAGRVYATKELKIEDEDNCSTLFKKMEDVAFSLLKENLEAYLENKIIPIEQDENKVSFSPSIKKEEEHLNLDLDSSKILGYIRALSDVPGAYLFLGEEKFKIFKAKLVSNKVIDKVGKIVKADKEGLHLQLKDGIIALLEVQKQGKNRISYSNFVNGNNILNMILR